ncbi:MAG: hypothetical protein LKF79_03035 [Solobacterium sp.]|jgi:hypothetical protein|nr:hypothetical protein [Solobacterium sp.]MCH4222712.1 hypothetical protein [Solobacterium sp.]MCH4265601.1 hypothetical protein [Solobacterium sp.]
MLINNSEEDTVVTLPVSGSCYVLSAENLRSDSLSINGHVMKADETGMFILPDANEVPAGEYCLKAHTVTFILL